MAKFRANTTACREREAVCFGGLASPHFSIYKRELARKERSRSRKALTVALALATAALFSACVGCVVYLLRDSGTVLGMGGESESGADSVGEMLVRARETAKKERTASGDEVSEGTSELRIEGLTGIDFVTVTSAWSKIYNIPRGIAVQQVDVCSQTGGVQMEVGDVVTSINGTSVFGINEAYTVLSGIKDSGECRAEMTFYRNGQSYLAVFVLK